MRPRRRPVRPSHDREEREAGRAAEGAGEKVVWTVGHSNREAGYFLSLLESHSIEVVVDVRTVPKSRHNPQFGSVVLEKSLARAGIGYVHMAPLGGFRRASKDSVNTGWENSSFRGFADYMQTADFAAGLRELEGLASRKRVALMCAEAVPWRCHRSLIADALDVRGWKVLHIQSRVTAKRHSPTPFMRVRDGRPVYPASPAA